MKKAAIMALCLLALLLVSCDPEQNNPDTTTKFNVTFYDENGVVISVATYNQGEALYVNAPVLTQDTTDDSSYLYWDSELDAEVTRDMDVKAVVGTGKCAYFFDTQKRVVKIVRGDESEVSVSEENMPRLPEIEGYTGVWYCGSTFYTNGSHEEQYGFYCSNDTYESNGMPKSFIVEGTTPFTIFEYPICGDHDKGWKPVNSENMGYGYYYGECGKLSSSDLSRIISAIGENQGDYAAKDTAAKTEFLVAIEDAPSFAKVIDSLRKDQGHADGWSVPQSNEAQAILWALSKVSSGYSGYDSYYAYLNPNNIDIYLICSDEFVNNQYLGDLYTTMKIERNSKEVYLSQQYAGAGISCFLWPVCCK